MNSTLLIYKVGWIDIAPMSGYVYLPKDTGSLTACKTEDDFEKWREHFIRDYGNEGYLVKLSKSRYRVDGNPKYDAIISLKKKVQLKMSDLHFSFDNELQSMDFDMEIKFETPPKKTHITILEKPKKVSDASTKLF